LSAYHNWDQQGCVRVKYPEKHHILASMTSQLICPPGYLLRKLPVSCLSGPMLRFPTYLAVLCCEVGANPKHFSSVAMLPHLSRLLMSICNYSEGLCSCGRRIDLLE